MKIWQLLKPCWVVQLLQNNKKPPIWSFSWPVCACKDKGEGKVINKRLEKVGSIPAKCHLNQIPKLGPLLFALLIPLSFLSLVCSPALLVRPGTWHLLCDLQLLTSMTCPDPASYFCRTPPGSSFEPSSSRISITEAPCLYSGPLRRPFFPLHHLNRLKALGIFPSLTCEMGKMRREEEGREFSWDVVESSHAQSQQASQDAPQLPRDQHLW